MTITIVYNKNHLDTVIWFTILGIFNLGFVFNTWNFFTSGVMTNDFVCGSSFGFIDMITQKPNCQYIHTSIHPFIPFFLNSIILVIDGMLLNDWLQETGRLRFVAIQSNESVSQKERKP